MSLHRETGDLFINMKLVLWISPQSAGSGKRAERAFLVYIVRQNESLHDIVEKYHTSVEEVEKYNDVGNITIGSKLIIPLMHD